LDRAAGRGRIGLEHSIFALECGPSANGPVCYMFEGFMTGAFRYLMGDNAGVAEVDLPRGAVRAEGRYERCRFEFAAAI